MVDNNEDKLLQDLKMGLDFMDGNIKVETPDIRQFRQLVAKAEEKKQEKAVFETVLFLLSAALILCLETFAFSRSMTLFAVVQVFALLVMPVAVLVNKKSRNRRMDAYEK